MTADDWIKSAIGGALMLAFELGRRLSKRLDDHGSKLDDHIEDSTKTSGEQATAIARLQERQSATTGWLEAIDKRLEAGFDKLEKKIDSIGARRS